MGGMKIFKDYGPHISDIKWVTCIIWRTQDATTRAILNITARNANMMLPFSMKTKAKKV